MFCNGATHTPIYYFKNIKLVHADMSAEINLSVPIAHVTNRVGALRRYIKLTHIVGAFCGTIHLVHFVGTSGGCTEWVYYEGTSCEYIL